jgi:PBSX family phage terminase large subunit
VTSGQADEVAFCRGFLEFYDKVLAPTLLTTKGRAVFGSTPNGFNDFYTLTERARNLEGWFYSHATSYDNPANEAVEIERIKSEITEDRFAQEYLADFRKLEGLVFKEFSRERHVYSGEVERCDEYIAGVDFGYKNPCAVIHIKRNGDDAYFVTEEWYKTERSEEQIADYVKSCDFNRVYPDPENPSAISLLNEKGIAIVEVTKGKGSIKSGIDKIHLLFKMGRLKIHESCTSLIWELENYRYPDSRPNHNDDENPIKENDHAIDAMRYALMTNRADNVIPPHIQAANYWEKKRNSSFNTR